LSTQALKLRTSRLLLVPIGDADVAALARHWGEQAVARYLWIAQPVTLESVAAVVTVSNRDFATSGYGVWAIRDPDDSTLIGMCGLRQVEGRSWVEILFSLRQRYWGRGLGTEAVFAVLDYAFQRLGLERVVAVVDPENPAVEKLARHAGMSFWQEDGPRRYWEAKRERFLAISKRPPPPTEIG
jgi:RimJ/RimL family protein N-acetyltransferase